MWLARVCCLTMLGLCGPLFHPSSAMAQVPGVAPPDSPRPSGRSSGFGLSINLGDVFSLLRAAQSGSSEPPDLSRLQQYATRQLIVAWDLGLPLALEPVAANVGARIAARSNLANLGLGIAELEFDSDDQMQQALPQLISRNPGLIADRHALGYLLQGTQDAASTKEYALDLIQGRGVRRIDGAIVVGLVDTDLASAAGLDVSGFRAQRFLAPGEKPASGSHVQGVAAIVAGDGAQGAFVGVAPGVAVRAASVMKELAPGLASTDTYTVALALDWLAGEKAKVVNLSLGSAHDAILALVVARTLAAGVVLVAAAGNGGPGAPPTFPAAYRGVIAVTAVDRSRSLYARANRGDYVALAAPGVDIWVPVDGGQSMSGTSFAAPFVTGAVARLLGRQPGLRPGTTVLETLCAETVDLGVPGVDPEFGCGLLQIRRD